jgi:hypothetical protein
MARYSAFLGRRVEVHYRAGDNLYPASGTFVADSGRSIFLEQHLEQRGQMKHFRWEIPYKYIVRLEERSEGSTPVTFLTDSKPRGTTAAAPALPPKEANVRENPDASPVSPVSILPLQNPPKIA